MALDEPVSNATMDQLKNATEENRRRFCCVGPGLLVYCTANNYTYYRGPFVEFGQIAHISRLFYV
jgi:hypothetical protein